MRKNKNFIVLLTLIILSDLLVGDIFQKQHFKWCVSLFADDFKIASVQINIQILSPKYLKTGEWVGFNLSNKLEGIK